MFLHLPTFIKVATPLFTVLSIGGGIFLVNSISNDKSNWPLDSVYLLVQATEVPSYDDVGYLGSYFCEYTTPKKVLVKDDVCSIKDLEYVYHSDDENERNLMKSDHYEGLQGSNYINEKNISDYYILKVSKDFYSHLASPSTIDKRIRLVQKYVDYQISWSFTLIVNLNFTTEKDLLDPPLNLFLARVKDQGDPYYSSYWNVEPKNSGAQFSCSYTNYHYIPCNVYKLPIDYNKRNNLTNKQLSASTLITGPNDIVEDSLLIVELTGTTISTSEIKTKHFTIWPFTTKNTVSYEKVWNKSIANVSFDQALFGKPFKTGQGHVLAVAPKIATFLVEKTPSFSTYYDSLNVYDSRKYICRFDDWITTTQDNSCTIKALPKRPKVHSFSSINKFYSFHSQETGDVKQYLLNVDINKLHDLKTDWKSTLLQSVDVSSGDSGNFSKNRASSFNVIQQIDNGDIVGLTNLIFVKYDEVLPTMFVTSTGKCGFSNKESSAVPCSLDIATNLKPTSQNFNDTIFKPFDVEDYIAVAFNKYFAFTLSGYKNINYYKDKDTLYFWTSGIEKIKIPFKIVATMGGSTKENQVSYFLEQPRGLRV